MSPRREHSKGARTIEFLLLIALPIVFHFLIPIAILISGPFRLIGIVVMIAGAFISTRAGLLFRKAGAGFELKTETPSLVTAGVFQFSRNPIYLGMITWLLGLAVLLGSLSPFLFPLFLFFLLNFSFIPLEEARLKKLFGTEYQVYRSTVRRWL